MRNYKERESLSKKEMAKKMDEAKKEVNTRESSVYLKVKIYKVSAEFLAKKTIVDGSASSLADAKAKHTVQNELNSKIEAELGEELVSLTSMVEKMDSEYDVMKKQLDKEIKKNHEQDGKLKRLNHEKEGHSSRRLTWMLSPP